VRRRLAIAFLAGVALTACGGGDDGEPDAAGASTTTDGGDGGPAVPGLELLEAEAVEGDELRPLLSWSAFDGAARYSVLVFDGDGAAYWAWEGADTQVHLGGGTDEPLPDGSEGPTTERAATWFVVAHDDGGEPVAASPELSFPG